MISIPDSAPDRSTPRTRSLRRAWFCRFAVAVLMLIACGSVTAQSSLLVTPNPAPSGTPIAVTLVGANVQCDPISSWSVERAGTVVTLRVNFALGACGVPPPIDHSLPLGPFLPGRYTLNYEATSPIGTIPPLTTTFDVFAAPRTVPAMQGGVALLLLALCVGLGGIAFSRRH